MQNTSGIEPFSNLALKRSVIDFYKCVHAGIGIMHQFTCSHFFLGGKDRLQFHVTQEVE
jgi:hypothetical protein